MSARIYRPARNAMQSGTAKTRDWVLEYVSETAREVDPLMGWTSNADTQAQVRLRAAALVPRRAHLRRVDATQRKVGGAEARGGDDGVDLAPIHRVARDRLYAAWNELHARGSPIYPRMATSVHVGTVESGLD